MAMYRNPEAAMNVLSDGPPSAEEQEIASRIMNEGLSSIAQEGTGMPQEGTGMPQEGMGIPFSLPTPPNPNQNTGNVGGETDQELLERMMRSMDRERREEWLLKNENEPLPWNPDSTWGEYLGKIAETQGIEAVDSLIDEEMKKEAENPPPNEGGNEMPVLPSIPMPPSNQELQAAVPPVAEQGGIMAAARGGLVGFANGGMNQVPVAPVSEEEFMNLVSQVTDEAGIPDEAVDMVADVATQTTGGSPAANDNVMDSGIMQTVEAVDATEEDVSGIGSLVDLNAGLIEAGQEGLVHASPGELIFDPNRLPENQRNMLFAALDAAGIDPAKVTVGSDMMELNALTGLPAAGFGSFFKKIFKPVKKAVKKVGRFLKKNAGTILGIAGAMTGNPWMAAMGSGLGSLVEGKPIQSALLSAGLGYAGTRWVTPWVSEQLSGVAGTVGPGARAAVDAPIGSIFGPGSAAATLGKQGAAIVAAENTAARVAAEAAIKGGLGAGTEKLAIQAATNSLSNAGLSGVTQEAINQSAQRIGQKVAGDLASKAITTAAAAAAPAYGGASSFLQGALGKSVADVGGGIAAGALQQAATPMIETAILGIPGADQQAAMDAWNARYNYTPTPGELYQFYTTEYLPNQQVNVASTIGNIPGYGGISAAGGGYINGVGGPKSDQNLARLSDGEFVFTEAAVRGAGDGDRMAGAKRMYEMMQGLERRVA
tara:strand:- start:929 stop:3061 length:2133 start_codon:yes stop_codon:yes gene_type:complete